MAAKKSLNGNANGYPVTNAGKLLVLPLADIDLSYDNQRTGDWTQGDSKESESGNSFKELTESIREAGQKEAVIVRPKGKKYQLIAGFRRFAAIKQLAKEANALKTATINAVVKELDDLQAFEEHVLENTARDDLSGADLAFAAYNLQQHHASRGVNLSDNAVAARMGKNQSYISMLLRIVKSTPKMAKAWREAPVQLSISEMTRVAKLKEPALQEQEYQRLLEGKPDASGGGPGGKDWQTSATEKAVKMADLLGTLERKGLVTVDITWDENLSDLGIKLKSDCTERQRKAIGKAAREAYAKAKNFVEETPEVPAAEA